jgi:hypothetical protein
MAAAEEKAIWGKPFLGRVAAGAGWLVRRDQPGAGTWEIAVASRVWVCLSAASAQPFSRGEEEREREKRFLFSLAAGSLGRLNSQRKRKERER